jgi:hypothetical protein
LAGFVDPVAGLGAGDAVLAGELGEWAADAVDAKGDIAFRDLGKLVI